MRFFEYFTKNESEGKEIGKFECAKDHLVSAFTQLSHMVGIANPTTLASYSHKGVNITKKGNKYVIKLLMFEPPIELIWTDLMALEDLLITLEKLAIDNKKVGYVNFKAFEDGQPMFQLALGV